MSPITAADPYPHRTVEVLDTTIAYVEAGRGDPIVLLHGNPTSSYLWRNVIPHLEEHGRCLAPDLVGMGRSGPSRSGGYRFVDHYDHLEAWMEAVGATDRVMLVVHDWGSGLGFHWAHRHPEAVRGIAYMEAIVATVSWDDWPETGRRLFQGLRSDAGEEMILEKNVFVERVLPGSIIRDLSEEEMERYREPFREAGESRRPTLTWPRQIPIDGEPADVHAIVEAYGEWLATAPIPKLFVNAEPGAILIGRQRKICRTWPHQTEVTVPGIHFVQEDSPDEIGAAVAAFVADLD
jgi:haloalkane dehalogenase